MRSSTFNGWMPLQEQESLRWCMRVPDVFNYPATGMTTCTVWRAECPVLGP